MKIIITIKMKLIIDEKQRYAKARAHTATHIMHYFLDKMLEGTKQAGSFVDEDYLRFDFATSKPLTDSQIFDIEKQVNDIIYQSLCVSKKEMTYDEAIKSGAKAFFEDKYGDKVRVVAISDDNQLGNLNRQNHQISSGDFFSVELCGGTHIDNTREIGAFKIIGQEAVASGTRRIVAITGPKVAGYAMQKDLFLTEIAQKLDCSIKQIPDKIDKIIKDFNQTKSECESIQSKLITDTLYRLVDESKKLEKFDMIINISKDDFISKIDFKEVVLKAKEIWKDKNLLLFADNGNYMIYIGRGGISAKEFVKSKGLKGGGSDNFLQGKDIEIVKL